MKKELIKIIFFFVVLLTCSCALAHSGRTDSFGGHYNHSTGEYHYHHGYSAHQHYDGVCPYDTSAWDQYVAKMREEQNNWNNFTNYIAASLFLVIIVLLMKPKAKK